MFYIHMVTKPDRIAIPIICPYTTHLLSKPLTFDNPEDGSNKLLRKVGNHIAMYTASHLIKIHHYLC